MLSERPVYPLPLGLGREHHSLVLTSTDVALVGGGGSHPLKRKQTIYDVLCAQFLWWIFPTDYAIGRVHTHKQVGTFIFKIQQPALISSIASVRKC